MRPAPGTTDRTAGATSWIWLTKSATPVIETLSKRPAGLLLGAIALFMFANAFGENATSSGSADRASILVARTLYAASGTSAVAIEPKHLRPPAYPLILTAMAHLDAAFGDGLACATELPIGCGDVFPFRSLVVIQVLVGVFALFLVHRLARQLSGSQEVALIALLLAFIFGGYGEFTGNLFPHAWYQLGAIASVYSIASAVSRPCAARHLAAGACIGLTSLFEPTFLVLVPVAAFALSTGRNLSPRSSKARSAGLVVAGCAIGLIPLLLLAGTLGYDLGGIGRHMSWHLAERVAFNPMDQEAWCAGLLLPIPIIGPIAGNFLPAELIASFGYYTPGTYVYDGANRIFPMALTQSGTSVQQTLWIAKTHILLEPWAYLSSSGPVFVRGLFAATGLLGLVGALHLPRMLRWSQTGPTYGATMSVVVSTIALLIELLPVPRTSGLGVLMGLEVANGTTEFQPGVQARGGEAGARAWGVGCAGCA